MACETRRPRHQSQLNPRFGGIHGGVNCTASSAAMVAEAVLCGPDRVILAKQVRASSDEPVPDPELPGLTLGQVAAALDVITNGAVPLTIKQPIRMDRLEARLRRGQVAILQVRRKVLIDQGHDLGHVFAGSHAIAIGFDRGELWVDDPMGRGKYPSTFAEIAQAAGALRLGGGATVGHGLAWAAFGTRPRSQRARATVRIPAGAVVRRFRMKGGLFFEVQPIVTPGAVDAVCTEPRRCYAHLSGPAFGMPPRNLAVVLTGPSFLRGFAVRDGAPHVTIDELADGQPMPVIDAEDAAFDVDDVTSPDLIDDPAWLAVGEADLAALAATDVEPAGVKNADMEEPLLPDDDEEDDDDELIRRVGS